MTKSRDHYIEEAKNQKFVGYDKAIKRFRRNKNRFDKQTEMFLEIFNLPANDKDVVCFANHKSTKDLVYIRIGLLKELFEEKDLWVIANLIDGQDWKPHDYWY